MAAGLAVASAEDGDEGETFVTRLEPGDNLVGWTEHAAPIQDLLDEVPQIEFVYTWDAGWQRYRYHHPDVALDSGILESVTSRSPVVIRIGDEPTSAQELFDAEPRIQFIYRWDEIDRHWDAAWPDFPLERRTLDALAPGTTAWVRVESEMDPQELFAAVPQIDLIYRYDDADDRPYYAIRDLAPARGDLTTLTPGMGLVLRLRGDEPVEWVRPRRPAQGTVKLLPGRNLVAWMGRDNAPIDWLVKGIGTSLTRLDSWSPTTQEWVSHKPRH